MSLKEKFKAFINNVIISDLPPAWNDDNFHPITNFIAERTGYSPAWIESKLEEWETQKNLSDITPKEAIKYLKLIEDIADPDKQKSPALSQVTESQQLQMH